MSLGTEYCPDCSKMAVYEGRNTDGTPIWSCRHCQQRWVVDENGRWSNKTKIENASLPTGLKSREELLEEEAEKERKERLREAARKAREARKSVDEPKPPYPNYMSGGKPMTPSIERKRAREWFVDHFWGVMIVITILIVSMLVITLLSFVNVPAGHKGVVVAAPRNSFIGHTFNEGWHFNPYLVLCDVEIIRYNTQTIEYSTVVAGDEVSNYGPVNVRSLDNLELDVSFSITFHIPADQVSHMRIQYGDITQTIIMQVARSTPRDVASHYAGLDMAGPMRPIYEKQVATNISERLGQYNIVVEMVNLRSIQLPEEVDMAVQRKKVAEQEYIAAEYQKNRTIVLAEGQAQAVIINATAQAQAIILRANGSAEAVRLVMDQLMASDANSNVTTYLTWLYLQALTDPNSNIQYIIVTDGTGTPIILNPQGG